MVGSKVVTTPDTFAVDPIEIAVPAIPINVESGVYVNSSLSLKKWLLMFIVLVVVLIVPAGLNFLEYIGTPSCFNTKSFLLALKPAAPS